MRVTHYQATVFHSSTGSSHTGMYPFTQAHADEAVTVLEADGINIGDAQKLCDKWTTMGSKPGSDIRYTYQLSMIDLLRGLDSK